MKMEFPLTYGLRKTGLPLILTSGKLKNVCFLMIQVLLTTLYSLLFTTILKMSFRFRKRCKKLWE